MSSGQNTSSMNSWVYVPSELASHIPSSFFVRLINFEYSPMNRLSSRRGLEPVRYLTHPALPSGQDSTQGVIRPTFTPADNTDYSLNTIQTGTLELFGDSLIVCGPNASSFYILPFSVTAQGTSKLYEYLAKDVNGNLTTGNERGGFHLYNGKVVMWNGLGTFQTFANTISESGFVRLDNDILPLEDQTIIGACTFESRLVVVSLQGYLMWSQPNWDGTSVWQDSEGNAINYVQISTDPGEIIEFVRAFRGGLILSTRTTANVSGRILNVPSLDPTQLQVIDTGVDSFFTRNSVISSTDQLVGISPQGVINVSYDSLARTAKAEFSTSAPIIEYLSEIFEDNSIQSYLDAFMDTKNRKGYFVHDWSLNGIRESKILSYDYNSDRWTLLKTELPVQRIFQMYDQLCCAGWVKQGSSLYLGIWAFSEYPYDVSFSIGSEVVNGSTVYFNNSEIDHNIYKSFVTGTINATSVGANEVPGTGQKPLQVIFSTEDPAEYKLGLRGFSRDSWGGMIEDFNPVKMVAPSPIEEYATSDTDLGHAKWDVTLKNHSCYQRFNIPLPNHNLYYQLLFESTAPTRFHFHSMSRDASRKL